MNRPLSLTIVGMSLLLVPVAAQAQVVGGPGNNRVPPGGRGCVGVAEVYESTDAAILVRVSNSGQTVAGGAVELVVSAASGAGVSGSASNPLPIPTTPDGGLRSGEVYPDQLQVAPAIDYEQLGSGDITVTLRAAAGSGVTICPNATVTLRRARGAGFSSRTTLEPCSPERDRAIGCGPADRSEGGACGIISPERRTLRYVVGPGGAENSSPLPDRHRPSLIVSRTREVPPGTAAMILDPQGHVAAYNVSDGIRAPTDGAYYVGYVTPPPAGSCNTAWQFWDRRVARVAVGPRMVWRPVAR